MAEETRETPRGGGARTLLAWVAILGLAGVVVWLLAERNARQWWLVPEKGLLVVKRGMPLPAGRRNYETNDPAMSEAYAPLVPPPGATLPPERAFEDRSGLDQALFDLLAGWAEEDIGSGEPSRLERGLGYLSRAQKLAGVSTAQREALQVLRAESAYYEAQRLLARAAESLRQAADKLRLAAGSPSERGADAQLLLRQVEPAVDAALAASRAMSASQRAGDTSPSPPPEEETPRPAEPRP